MNPITIKPRNNQKCLVEHGGGIEPAIYDADDDTFKRYPNYTPGDRCLSYFYSGVTGWLPFPEPKRSQEFVNEPELPFPPAELFTQPLTKEEQVTIDEVYSNRDRRFWGEKFHKAYPQEVNEDLPERLKEAIKKPKPDERD